MAIPPGLAMCLAALLTPLFAAAAPGDAPASAPATTTATQPAATLPAATLPQTQPATATRPATPPAAASAGPQKNLREEYSIIVRRNIFSRDRGRRETPRRPDVVSAAPPAPSIENYVVLTGIVRQGDLNLAFFENTRTGEKMEVPAGRAMAKGTLVSIAWDHVEYRGEQATMMVYMGQNLRGAETSVDLAGTPAPPEPATATSAGTSQPPATSAQPAKGPATTLPAGETMEERMRRRRIEELK
jgi:hypothetical protein